MWKPVSIVIEMQFQNVLHFVLFSVLATLAVSQLGWCFWDFIHRLRNKS